MIIVRLQGGLGNQLFQYAVGRCLSHKLGVDLKLDITGYVHDGLRTYALANFNIVENIASGDEIARRKQGMVKRILSRCLRRPTTHIKEKNYFHFDPEILRLPDDIYLDGYWQNEKYFTSISEILRREFTVKTMPQGRNQELAGIIDESEAISLHIRRGDYVSNAATNQFHGTCDMAYYRRCLDQIRPLVKNPHLLVFSDDFEWVKNNFTVEYPFTLVDHNGADQAHEDLRLMSQCKYQIMANSTFSWWAAWLGKKNTMVFAPRCWLREIKHNPDGLYLNNWIKL
jgi:hypothetical protein